MRPVLSLDPNVERRQSTLQHQKQANAKRLRHGLPSPTRCGVAQRDNVKPNQLRLSRKLVQRCILARTHAPATFCCLFTTDGPRNSSTSEGRAVRVLHHPHPHHHPRPAHRQPSGVSAGEPEGVPRMQGFCLHLELAWFDAVWGAFCERGGGRWTVGGTSARVLWRYSSISSWIGHHLLSAFTMLRSERAGSLGSRDAVLAF